LPFAFPDVTACFGREPGFYTIFGGELGEGAIVVSRYAAPVDFAELLNDRVANLVPVDTVEDTFRYFDAYTQTVGGEPWTYRARQIDDVVEVEVRKLGTQLPLA
jgi:hypothetical protein